MSVCLKCFGHGKRYERGELVVCECQYVQVPSEEEMNAGLKRREIGGKPKK